MAEEIVLTGPKTTLQEDLTRLYSQGFLTDITLSTEDGKNFEAHRILLAARSLYFHSIVPRMRTSEPVIFLKGVKGAHLDKILKYIYSGSVSLSRHQLKPILEVAKSLQVKGLYDQNPADILSRQGLTGPSPSALQAIASRTGGNPTMISSSIAARAAQRPMASPPASSTSFKSSPSSATSSAANRANRSRFMSSTSSLSRKDEDEDDSDSDDEIVLNKSKQDSDLDDDDDEDDEDDIEDKKPETPVKPTKRKRGRPPKNKKSSEGASSNDKSNDPYEFDADEGTSGQMRSSSGEKGKSYRMSGGGGGGGSGKKAKEEDDEESALASRNNRSNKYTQNSAINGKQILAVKCKNQTAELHLSRFANGIRGNSIKYKDQWMTPQQFEESCGTNNHKYLENIQTDYGPLKTLTQSGMLKPHSRKCRCSVCRGEEVSPKTDKLKAKKRSKNDEEEGGEEEEDPDEATDVAEQKESHEVDQEQQTHDVDEEHQHHHKDKKRKKKREMREMRKQLLAEQLKQEAANQQQQQQQQQHHQQHQHQQHQQHHQHQQQQQQPQTITIVDEAPNYDQQNQLHHMQIHQPQGEIYVTAISTMNPTMVSTISDMPPKISPPNNELRIEPPQHAQPPTFYVMSPHPHLAPPTPQHNPFANMGPPPPQSPAPSLTSQISSPSTNANLKSQNGLKDSSSGSNASTPTSSVSNVNTGNVPRMGPVMNVRCKSTTAVMYTAKYESGSKGKCIQLGDEWLTPNEFEDRAGSKAKKYLSSIKCLGRPLRVFVNSGELKGTGPPPAPKVTKKVKPSAVQPIAPAPPPGSGMLTTPQLGQITAPPTPSHISSAPPIPANMIMGGQQPPILINQTSMASTMLGNQAMMPSYITIGTPLDVRQNVSQAM